jgi:hypothetical protein
MTVARCRGINRGGKRCGARPITGTEWCINHSPDIADETRKAWSAKGGRNSAARVRARKQLPGEILTSDELAAWLSVVFRQLIVGKIDPPIATAAANLARTMTEISRAADVQTRLDELEHLLDIRRAS